MAYNQALRKTADTAENMTAGVDTSLFSFGKCEVGISRMDPLHPSQDGLGDRRLCSPVWTYAGEGPSSLWLSDNSEKCAGFSVVLLAARVVPATRDVFFAGVSL